MPLLYTRTETEDTIVIVYPYHVVFYIVLLGVILLATPDAMEPFAKYLVGFLFIFGIVWIFGHHSSRKEIKQAMKKGNVAIKGNKFSFKNPITYTIKK